MKLRREDCRHDSPYDASERPEWWPTAMLAALIRGEFASYFKSLCKLIGERRAVIAILEIAFKQISR